MTEKQFKINTSEIGYIYIDNLKGEHMSWVELEKTLNRLYAQNKELFKENKKLKQENQHIKNTIKEAYNNERTQLGKSVLKQLMEAIQ